MPMVKQIVIRGDNHIFWIAPDRRYQFFIRMQILTPKDGDSCLSQSENFFRQRFFPFGELLRSQPQEDSVRDKGLLQKGIQGVMQVVHTFRERGEGDKDPGVSGRRIQRAADAARQGSIGFLRENFSRRLKRRQIPKRVTYL